MMSRAATASAIWLAALCVPIVISAGRLNSSRMQHAAALTAQQRIINEAQQIIRLRTKQQRIAEHKRPEQDVIARVNTTLAEAGIPSERFGGLRPESDAALPNTAYRRQSVRISLDELSIIELGAFLSRWSTTQRLWTPTRIELTHARSRQGSDRYDATILITATYLADGERR